jgi:hypothetical protein
MQKKKKSLFEKVLLSITLKSEVFVFHLSPSKSRKYKIISLIENHTK